MIERKLYQVKECTEEVTPSSIIETHYNVESYLKSLLLSTKNMKLGKELEENLTQTLAILKKQENSLCISN